MLLNLAIELTVAGLLIATILYCVRLNTQLKRLRADSGEMRKTMENLVAATHNAERALAALKDQSRDVERGLVRRVDEAQRCSTKLSDQLNQAEDVLSRIGLITKAARDGGEMPMDAGPAAPSTAPFHRAA